MIFVDQGLCKYQIMINLMLACSLFNVFYAIVKSLTLKQTILIQAQMGIQYCDLEQSSRDSKLLFVYDHGSRGLLPGIF